VGDLIGLQRRLDRCVNLLRERGAICITGNHDLIGTGELGSSAAPKQGDCIR